MKKEYGDNFKEKFKAERNAMFSIRAELDHFKLFTYYTREEYKQALDNINKILKSRLVL